MSLSGQILINNLDVSRTHKPCYAVETIVFENPTGPTRGGTKSGINSPKGKKIQHMQHSGRAKSARGAETSCTALSAHTF